jgi:hypothetical protein
MHFKNIIQFRIWRLCIKYCLYCFQLLCLQACHYCYCWWWTLKVLTWSDVTLIVFFYGTWSVSVCIDAHSWIRGTCTRWHGQVHAALTFLNNWSLKYPPPPEIFNLWKTHQVVHAVSQYFRFSSKLYASLAIVLLVPSFHCSCHVQTKRFHERFSQVLQMLLNHTKISSQCTIYINHGMRKCVRRIAQSI